MYWFNVSLLPNLMLSDDVIQGVNSPSFLGEISFKFCFRNTSICFQRQIFILSVTTNQIVIRKRINAYILWFHYNVSVEQKLLSIIGIRTHGNGRYLRTYYFTIACFSTTPISPLSSFIF